MGPSIGGTKIKVSGLGFELFPLSDEEKRELIARKKAGEGRHRGQEEDEFTQNELWVRYMGLDGNLLAGPFLVDPEAAILFALVPSTIGVASAAVRHRVSGSHSQPAPLPV